MHRKERFSGFNYAQKEELTRKRMESIVKATARNLHLTRKKEKVDVMKVSGLIAA